MGYQCPCGFNKNRGSISCLIVLGGSTIEFRWSKTGNYRAENPESFRVIESHLKLWKVVLQIIWIANCENWFGENLAWTTWVSPSSNSAIKSEQTQGPLGPGRIGFQPWQPGRFASDLSLLPIPGTSVGNFAHFCMEFSENHGTFLWRMSMNWSDWFRGKFAKPHESNGNIHGFPCPFNQSMENDVNATSHKIFTSMMVKRRLGDNDRLLVIQLAIPLFSCLPFFALILFSQGSLWPLCFTQLDFCFLECSHVRFS